MPLFESQISTSLPNKFLLQTKSGEEIVLKEGKTTIGRDSAIKTPNDHFMSKRHAKIVLRKGKCTLHDLGSKNGTRLNGKKIRSSKVLSNKDKIVCGKSHFIFKQISIE